MSILRLACSTPKYMILYAKKSCTLLFPLWPCSTMLCPCHDSFSGGMPSMDMSSEKLLNLGWKYRSLEESLVDAVKNYEERGDLAKN